MPRLAPVAAWCALVALTLGLAWRDWDTFQVGLWTDDAKYLVLSRSLLHADTYGAASIGPEPGFAAYPFGFPLLLAPFVALAPEDFALGQIVSLAATILNLGLLFWGWPRLSGMRSRWWALAAAALYGLSPGVASHAHMVMSEPLFTSLALCALLLSERGARARGVSVGAYTALGFAMTAATFTRTIGVALWPALLLRLAWRWRAGSALPLAAVATGAALLLVPVLIATPVTSADLIPSRYLESFRDPTIRGNSPLEKPLAGRVGRSIMAYSTADLRAALVAVGGGGAERRLGERIGFARLPELGSLLVTALVLVGALASVRRGFSLSVLLFEVAYIAITLTWHHRSARFLYPLVPFLGVQLLLGVGAVTAFACRSARVRSDALPRAATAAAAILLVGACLVKILPRPTAHFQTRDLRLGAEWLRDHGEAQEVVLAEDAFQAHLYSKRPVVALRQHENEAVLVTRMKELDVKWVLVTPMLEWSLDGRRHYSADVAGVLLPLLARLTAEGKAQVVYESPAEEMVQVYRLSAAAGDL